MPMHIHCLYTPPCFGEGGIISCCWYQQMGDTPIAVCVPLIGGVPQWHWAAQAPAGVQDALRQVYAAVQEGTP